MNSQMPGWLSRGSRLPLRIVTVVLTLAITGVAFAASAERVGTISATTTAPAPSVKADKTTKLPVKTYSSSLGTLGVSEGVSIATVGVPTGIMYFNNGAAATASTAATIDSSVSDATLMMVGTQFAQIDGGPTWAAGVGTDGSLWRWGTCGTLVSKAVRVGTDNDWTMVAVGNTAAAIKTDGTLWTFGPTSAPVKLGTETYRTVAAGNNHFIAIRQNGWLVTWGANGSGQLGAGNTSYYFNQVYVSYDTNWKAVAAGGWHTAAVNTAGQLYTWGYNYYGQLGNASTTNRTTMTLVGSGYSDVFAGENTTYAIGTDSKMYACGYNNQGALGTGDFNSAQSAHVTLQPVGSGSTGWVDVAPGKSHAIARKSDGTIWSWGYGNEGQKGTGVLSATATPGQIGTQTNWTEIGSGDNTSYAIAGGLSFSWGVGTDGCLGDGQTTNRTALGPSMQLWEPYTAHYPITLAQSDGVQGISVTYSDALNNMLTLTDGITVDVTPPTISASIQWGDSFTRTLNVGVNVYPSADAVQLRFNGGAWGNVADVIPGNLATVTLSPPDGVKTIQIDAIDAAGNIGSTTVGITLDTTSPSGTMSVNGGANATRTPATGVDSNVAGAAYMRYVEQVWTSVEGGSHLMLLRPEGSLWGLGANGSGQIGDGTTTGDPGAYNPTDREQPTRTSGTEVWKQVEAATGATFAIRSDDTLWSWGGNGQGLLGTGDLASRSVPGPVSGGGTWRTVSANTHALAIDSLGRLWAWGANTRGQVGDGSITQRNAPVMISGDTDWKSVYAGDQCSFAIKTNGTLWAWGYNSSGRTGLGTTSGNTVTPTQVPGADWAMVAPGANTAYGTAFAVATKTSGTLWSWGSDGSGALGRGAVTSSASPAQVGSDADWAFVAAGSDHAGAIKSTGTLWTWGGSTYGQLGQGIITSVNVPTQVGSASDWRELAFAGGTNGYATNASGQLFSWGYGTRCAPGNYSRRNILSPVPGGWYKYAAQFPIVFTEVGTAPVTMSYHDYAGNELNLSTMVTYDPNLAVSMKLNGGAATTASTTLTIDSSVLGSTTMRIGRKWNDVHVGDGYTMLHAADGPVEFTGYGSLGQRGSADLTYRTTSFVFGGATRTWREYAAGGKHSIAIAPDGSLWVWGYNDHGELGSPGTTNAPSPVMLTPGIKYKDVFAGLHTSYAIRDDGTLWAWGANSAGELGDGTTVQRSTMVQIGADTDWAEVSNWGSQTLALKTNGELWAWGPNGWGQLGLGDAVPRLVPTRVGTGTWNDISAGYGFSLGVDSGGKLWAWGFNSKGQLGDASTSTRYAPVKISDLQWRTVDAGVQCSFGIRSDGTLWAWGDNSGGQLGDGTATQRTTPVRIGTRSDWELVDSGGTPEFSPVVGYLTTVGTTTNGAVFTWGENAFGQQGSGNFTGSSSPVERVRSPLAAYAPSTVFTAPWASGETTIHACYVDSANNVTWLSDSIMVAPPAPVISRLSPADGDVAESATPEITARVDLSLGSLPVTTEVRVDGVLVPSTYEYGTTNLVRAPTGGLADDAWHAVEIKVTDAVGQVVTAAGSFLLEGGTKMLHWDAADCRTCHGAAVPHTNAPMMGAESTCLVCHMGIHNTQVEQPAPRYYNCYCHTSGTDPRYLNWTHRLDPAKCLTCHTKYNTGLDPDRRETVIHVQNVPANCKPCHRSELRFEHALRTNDLGQTLTCETCHDSADPLVVNAIATNDKACATCHPGVDHRLQHEEPALTAMCAKCHEANLLDEHTDRGVVCDTCHLSADPLVTTAIAAGDGACASCHGANPSVHLTAGMQPVNKVACANCHWSAGTVGTSLGGIHTHATTWLTLRYNCQACHATPALTRMFSPPSVEGPYGAFATVGSATASAETLHRIHTKGSPSLGTVADATYCNSCHGAVACGACHGAVSHTNHAWSTSMGAYLAPPVDMAVTTGVLPTAPAAERKTLTTRSVTCIGSGCHELSADGVPVAAPDCTRCHS